MTIELRDSTPIDLPINEEAAALNKLLIKTINNTLDAQRLILMTLKKELENEQQQSTDINN